MRPSRALNCDAGAGANLNQWRRVSEERPTAAASCWLWGCARVAVEGSGTVVRQGNVFSAANRKSTSLCTVYSLCTVMILQVAACYAYHWIICQVLYWLQSTASWTCYHPPRRLTGVCLQILLIDIYQQCGYWSHAVLAVSCLLATFTKSVFGKILSVAFPDIGPGLSVNDLAEIYDIGGNLVFGLVM